MTGTGLCQIMGFWRLWHSWTEAVTLAPDYILGDLLCTDLLHKKHTKIFIGITFRTNGKVDRFRSSLKERTISIED